MLNHRDIETAALSVIESAELTEEQTYVAYLMVLARQYLIENLPKGQQPKPLENWSTEEIIAFAKMCEDVKSLPH